MKTLIVNGRFFAQPLTGIQRFAYQVLKEFAKAEDVRFLVALPKDAKEPEIFSDNIEYVRVGKFTGTMWEQISLKRFCKRKKLPLLCTGNYAPILKNTFVVLHDLSYADKTISFQKESWRLKMKLLVRAYIYKSRRIFTVSEFSKEQILAHYPKLKRPPVVVPNGHEHVYEWREEPVEGLPEKFFLSVSSVSPHKNFSYILSLAEHNPDCCFVIAGKKNSTFEEELKKRNLQNCVFTGYVTDGQLLTLYKKCEGFILPSLYEGFGIPPLEAVACGCRRIFLSDIPVFREIYGDCAVFFDPKDYENTVSLDCEPMREETAQKLLETYSWKRTAEELRRVVTEE